MYLSLTKSQITKVITFYSKVKPLKITASEDFYVYSKSIFIIIDRFKHNILQCRLSVVKEFEKPEMFYSMSMSSEHTLEVIRYYTFI